MPTSFRADLVASASAPVSPIRSGKGTIVGVQSNLHRAGLALPVSGDAETNNSSIVPRAVLIVDDDPLVAEMLEDLLRIEFAAAASNDNLMPPPEMPIRRVATIAAAIEQLQAWPDCDMVLVDHLLPDGHGADLVQQIADRWPLKAAVMITGQGSEDVAVRAFHAGARDYLSKAELDGEMLAAAVRRSLLQLRSQQQERVTAEEVLRLRSEMDHFLRAISHDMGANLMVLESTVEVLKQETVPESKPMALDGFNQLEACLRQSNKFLTDLVTLARTGTIEMQPQRVEPIEIARQVALEQRRLLAERGIQLLIAENLPAIMVHPGRLKQVFTNLVRNAAKHGCAKVEPRIEIRTCEPYVDLSMPIENTNKNYVWFAVYDNGTGIPAEDRTEIFVPGKRLASAHPDGSGMGLAIVKKIVDYYGGQVLVDPRPANGTAMIFSFPQAE